MGTQHSGQRRFGLDDQTDRTGNERPLSPYFYRLCSFLSSVLIVSSPSESLQFLDIGFEEVYPLWAISGGGSGGLDWTSHEVGQV